MLRLKLKLTLFSPGQILSGLRQVSLTSLTICPAGVKTQSTAFPQHSFSITAFSFKLSCLSWRCCCPFLSKVDGPSLMVSTTFAGHGFLPLGLIEQRQCSAKQKIIIQKITQYMHNFYITTETKLRLEQYLETHDK